MVKRNSYNVAHTVTAFDPEMATYRYYTYLRLMVLQ